MEVKAWNWQAGAGGLTLGLGALVASGGKPLHLNDLSLCGLVLDLFGAYYLGRGLLIDPKTNLERAASRFGPSAPVMLGAARDRVDGQIGIAALLVGFSLQVLAYLLQLSSVGSETTGQRAVVPAIGLGLVVGACCHLLACALQRTLLCRELLRTSNVLELHGEYGWAPAALRNEFAHLITGRPGTELYDAALVERVFGTRVTHPEGPRGEPRAPPK